MYIDTHCHLSKDYYPDIDFIVSENINAGISKMILSGCDKKSISESIMYAEKYENIYVTIGYHPEEVSNVSIDEINQLKNIIKRCKKIVGIGEIGLDYHYEKESKEKQILLFEKQLEIAEELNLPVVIHSRDATLDTINCLQKYNVKGVIHCFSGSLEVANTYIKMGFKLGIGGVVTFKNSKLGEVIKNISLENIVLETDSPYLTPDPYRGKVNSSKYIPIIAQSLSSLYNVSLEEISKVTTENALNLFNFRKK